jgi:hypothetical protein
MKRPATRLAPIAEARAAVSAVMAALWQSRPRPTGKA